jgi:hypothetical protein
MTVTPDRTSGACATQISDVPACELLRVTSVQGSPTPLTVAVWGELAGPSYPTKATRRSPGCVVENAGVVILFPPSTKTVASSSIRLGGLELFTVTVSAAVSLTLAQEALKVTEVAAVTLLVVTENVAEVEPCGIVMEVGTVAALEFELESDITAPPDPAAAVRLTVPVPDWPPTIVAGLTETLLSAAGGGFTVTVRVVTLATLEYGLRFPAASVARTRYR